MAHKKGQGSTNNVRDSRGQRLGVKIFGGQLAKTGNIIVRQRGTQYHPGENVGIGKDHTIFALVDGTVEFRKRRNNRRYISVLPFEELAETKKKAAPKKAAPATEAPAEAAETTEAADTEKKTAAKKSTAAKKPAAKKTAAKKDDGETAKKPAAKKTAAKKPAAKKEDAPAKDSKADDKAAGEGASE